MHSRISVVKLLFRINAVPENIRRQLASEPLRQKKKKSFINEPVDGTSTTTNGSRILKEMKEYFKSIGNITILGKFPPELLTRNKKHLERFYLAHTESAELVAKHITAGLSPDMLLVEINPGPGLLTRELLKCDIKKLLLVESESHFESDLQKLMATKMKSEWDLMLAHFNGNCKLSYQNRGIKLEQLLAEQSQKQDEVKFKLFSAVDSLKFFKSLTGSVASQTGLFSLARWEMVVAVPPLIFMQLTCSRNAGYGMYRRHTVLFQIFFEHELLATIPRRHMLPWPPRAMKRKPYTVRMRYELEHADEWYLVRIIPRGNLLDLCPPDDLKALVFFISQSLACRTNRIIPTMEQWIPYSGARLILNQNYVPSTTEAPVIEAEDSQPTVNRKSSFFRKNDLPERITIFTEFGELTPSQMLSLFNEFKSWPEYRQSHFLTTMEQHDSKDHALSNVEGATETDTAEAADVEDTGIVKPSVVKQAKIEDPDS
ncbi:dimethyladenosine transferase 2, mitochondrial-like [Topomyia yanbarensis]|uniref:dimethyladenosine transferase 2, mitochondrial-like n=1 Tax=Topomyia yanbarensis TaxID=2498891 RepID=UPI00273C4FC3|nr:dimethyladenosine transferase 2, mitochondrial-like [Topomyia yanbarensis]